MWFALTLALVVGQPQLADQWQGGGFVIAAEQGRLPLTVRRSVEASGRSEGKTAPDRTSPRLSISAAQLGIDCSPQIAGDMARLCVNGAGLTPASRQALTDFLRGFDAGRFLVSAPDRYLGDIAQTVSDSGVGRRFVDTRTCTICRPTISWSSDK